MSAATAEWVREIWRTADWRGKLGKLGADDFRIGSASGAVNVVLVCNFNKVVKKTFLGTNTTAQLNKGVKIMD